MSDIEKRIEELVVRVQQLQRNQKNLNDELSRLHKELLQLQMATNVEVKAEVEAFQHIPEKDEDIVRPASSPHQHVAEHAPAPAAESYTLSQRLEDFIGTNLAGKAGILITIIGIFIGAKYAIDKELISPVMRIAFGYVAGLVLAFTALKLKSKYENYSAMLMGGGLAVLYFITYISYSFYQLFPQSIAFILMVVMTGLAVTTALWYNQKIIAILGQVAAYAIPFLLSDGSGKVFVLFTYISVINLGILLLSFKKNWKVLYRIAFIISWLIYASWSVSSGATRSQFLPGITFITINFLTFYATFLSYKIMRKELYQLGEVAILLLNALVYFFIGAALVNDTFTSSHPLTYFTVANAAVHLIVGWFMLRLGLADKSVYQFLFGLSFLFITLAIPIELDGSWVTLLWAIEAAVLSWIAVRNNRSLYLIISAPMILVAAISLIHDWAVFYPHLLNVITDLQLRYQKPFLNNTFWFSLFAGGCFGYVLWRTSNSNLQVPRIIPAFFKSLMPLIFLLALYFTFSNEIRYAFDYYLGGSSSVVLRANLNNLSSLTWIVFSLLFVALALEYSRRYVTSRRVFSYLLMLAIMFIAIFLLRGLYLDGELRQAFINASAKGEGFSSMLLLRYAAFAAVGVLAFTSWLCLKKIQDKRLVRVYTFVFNLTLLCIICNEFIHRMDLAGYQNQYKLGLSIILAVYALTLVIVGIKYQRKDLRMAAIVLFGFTLIKLFFYDLRALSTISKTLVLVILGVILLVVSFLYSKYKHVILDDDRNS